VYSADIDRGILFQEDRIKTFYCDQLDRSSIRELWSHPDLQAGVDIIIEDGLHTFEANVSFLEESLDRLRPGGIYICEDIMWNRVREWCDRLETIYSKQYPTYELRVRSLAGPRESGQQSISRSSGRELGFIRRRHPVQSRKSRLPLTNEIDVVAQMKKIVRES
jgi:hypothetical protein